MRKFSVDNQGRLFGKIFIVIASYLLIFSKSGTVDIYETDLDIKIRTFIGMATALALYDVYKNRQIGFIFLFLAIITMYLSFIVISFNRVIDNLWHILDIITLIAFIISIFYDLYLFIKPIGIIDLSDYKYFNKEELKNNELFMVCWDKILFFRYENAIICYNATRFIIVRIDNYNIIIKKSILMRNFSDDELFKFILHLFGFSYSIFCFLTLMMPYDSGFFSIILLITNFGLSIYFSITVFNFLKIYILYFWKMKSDIVFYKSFIEEQFIYPQGNK